MESCLRRCTLNSFAGFASRLDVKQGEFSVAFSTCSFRKIRNWAFAENEAMGHVDSLLAFPDRNTFIRTVVPFLKGIARSAH